MIVYAFTTLSIIGYLILIIALFFCFFHGLWALIYEFQLICNLCTQAFCYVDITLSAIIHATKHLPAHYKFQVLSVVFFFDLLIFYDRNQSDGTHSHNKPRLPGAWLCQTLKVLSPMAK